MLNAKPLMLVVLLGLLSVANALAASFNITIDAAALRPVSGRCCSESLCASAG